MKKTLLLIIAIVLVVSLSLVMFACGEDNGGNNGGNNNGNSHTHKYGEWKTTKAATCTEAGEETRSCTVEGCKEKETRAIAASGHKDADNDKKCDVCGADMGSQGGSQGGSQDVGGDAVKLTDADLQNNASKYAAVTELANFVSQYITNHAIEAVDNTAGINEALVEKVAASYDNTASVVATLKNGSYELKYTFKDNSYYVYSNPESLEAKAQVAGTYVGAALVEQTKQNKSEFKSGMAEVYNALVRTINQAIDEASGFGDLYIDKDGDAVFGGKVGASFAFNYGKMQAPVTYGLYVEGKIGRLSKNTNVKVEVKDENNGTVVVGLYYQGAEQAKDCKLYLSMEFGGYKQDIYLDNADINSIVNYFLDDYFSEESANAREHNCEHKTIVDDHCKDCGKYICEHEDANGDCACDKCGAAMHVDANNDNACDVCKKKMSMLVLPVDNKTGYEGYTSFGVVLKDMGIDMGTLIITIVNKLTTGTITKHADGSVTLQYYLDIEQLLADLLEDPTIKGALDDLDLESFTSQIEFLKDFDLASFQGVGGVLMFTFDLTAEKGGFLTGAEISYNVAERDFRWSKNDDEAKLYGPVNVALSVKDLDIDSEIEDVQLKEKASDYTYFNPLSGEITADVKVTEVKGEDKKVSEYKLDAKASFNPFEIALINIEDNGLLAGGAEFILKEKNSDATPVYVWIHDVECKDGSWDSKVDVLLNGKYYTTKASDSDFFSKQVWPYLVSLTDNQSIATDITKYVKELVAQFSSEDTRGDKEFDELKTNLIAMLRGLEAGDGTTDKSAILTKIKSDALAAINNLNWKSFDSYAAAADKANEIASKAAAEFAKQVVWENRSGVGVLDGMNIISIATNAGGWLDALKAGKVPVTDKDGKVVKEIEFMTFSLGSAIDAMLGLEMTADNGEPYIAMTLNQEVYNAVMDMLRVAIPNLPTFDKSAATVTVHCNDGEYNNKLEVVVEYNGVKVLVEGDMDEFFDVDNDGNYSVKANGVITSKVTVTFDSNTYVFDGKVQLVDWLTEEGEVNTDSGKIVATLDVDMNGKAYAYRGTLMLSKAEETENQIFTVTFEEKDGKMTEFQQFVEAELQLNDKEFDVTLTLAARGEEGKLLENHVYTIVGKYTDDNTVSLEIAGGNEEDSDVFGLTLGAKWNGVNKNGYMPLSIPDPNVGVTFGVKYNDNSVTVEVDNLTIASWTKEVKVNGFQTELTAEKDTDKALFDAILALVQPYLGGAKAE